MLKMDVFLRHFRVKILALQSTLLIDCDRFLWILILLREFGQENMFPTLTRRYLDAKILCMFQRSRDPRSMIKQFLSSSSDMGMRSST